MTIVILFVFFKGPQKTTKRNLLLGIKCRKPNEQLSKHFEHSTTETTRNDEKRPFHSEEQCCQQTST